LELKNAAQKGLNGTQHTVFFLQHQIEPLQARVSKLWSYSGAADPSRVSKKDLAIKDLEKRVKSMTKLTTKKPIPVCIATPFDAIHPLPKVPDFFDLHKYSALLFFLMFHFTNCSFLLLIIFVVGSSFFNFTPPRFPKRGRLSKKMLPPTRQGSGGCQTFCQLGDDACCGYYSH
jgi:hypothetical protein